jgi:lipopolysaccharide transport system ATP-binding protein
LASPLRYLASTLRPLKEAETFWALKDVSFEIKQGEVLGIIGRNGAGKSTLLKILSRITEPSSGRAVINGRVGSLLEVGTGFHPELTGRENIYLNGAILGMKKAEIDKKFDEIVEFAEVEKFLDTPVKRYSSGMYVRLAFAVAAQLEPEILLVDEVLAVGDVAFQRKCLGKMGDVARQGRTVLFVSHNMGSIANLCSHGILLGDGKVIYQGSSEKTIGKYLEHGSPARSEVYLTDARELYSDDLEFKSVKILERNGNPASQVLLSQGFEIEVIYQIKIPIYGSNVTFTLWNRSGICVFQSTDVDQDPKTIDSIRLPGFYISRCFVSGNYLRPGNYYIDIASSIPSVRILDSIANVISLEVVDDGSMESKISQGRLGTIAPCLRWVSKRIE